MGSTFGFKYLGEFSCQWCLEILVLSVQAAEYELLMNS